MSELPGKGFFGWLGRQIGYVRRAVKTDVAAKTIYRKQSIQQQAHPQDPKIKLRRTMIDEVIIDADETDRR